MVENKTKEQFFQCKQFSINHKEAALKVTTEALILGGYTAVNLENAQHILDIGTGTGLLALMLAQKTSANIDAVEIDEKAFLLANENINISEFKNKIKLYLKPIQIFENKTKYNVIVCNPPFYSNYLKGENTIKNIALHTETLSFEALSKAVKRLLEADGKFFVLLPPFQLQLLEKELALQNLIKINEFRIHHQQNSKVLRIIATFGFEMVNYQPLDFYIKEKNGHYTAQFIELLKDYYLIF
jgi:tRNA1Val (adenine37-N6)-methyltransferase